MLQPFFWKCACKKSPSIFFASKNNRIKFHRSEISTKHTHTQRKKKICEMQFNNLQLFLFLRLVEMGRNSNHMNKTPASREPFTHVTFFLPYGAHIFCWIADNTSECLHYRQSGSTRAHTLLTNSHVITQYIDVFDGFDISVSLTTKALNDRHKVFCLKKVKLQNEHKKKKNKHWHFCVRILNALNMHMYGVVWHKYKRHQSARYFVILLCTFPIFKYTKFCSQRYQCMFRNYKMIVICMQLA